MRVLAVLCADIHLSHRPPAARAVEPCWYGAMRRTLLQLRGVAEEHRAPIICAGDVFDRWNAPPALINFAIDNLPSMYAIPGQHDLPYHGYDSIEESAYQTLVKAGVVNPLTHPCEVNGFRVHPFPWGSVVSPLEQKDTNVLDVAVVHAYIWCRGYGFIGAGLDTCIASVAKCLGGYDVAVFGDNHKGFSEKRVFNCGCLIRRKSDECDYSPSVGLLMADGKVVRHSIDVTEDRFADVFVEEEMTLPGMVDFLAELRSLGNSAVNFEESVRSYLDNNKQSKCVEDVVLEALEVGLSGEL